MVVLLYMFKPSEGERPTLKETKKEYRKRINEMYFKDFLAYLQVPEQFAEYHRYEGLPFFLQEDIVAQADNRFIIHIPPRDFRFASMVSAEHLQGMGFEAKQLVGDDVVSEKMFRTHSVSHLEGKRLIALRNQFFADNVLKEWFAFAKYYSQPVFSAIMGLKFNHNFR